MKKSIRHACSLTRDTNRAASVTDHYLWINLERFKVKIWIIRPLDLFEDVLQTLANSQQKEIQSSFTLYTGQIDPQTWRVHVNQCGSFRCMRESTRGSYEAPESCRTRRDEQPLISSTLNIPSPLIWKRKTEMRRAANTATRLQWEQDRQTDLRQTNRQVLWETLASHRFHSNEGRDIKDAIILTLNSYTSKVAKQGFCGYCTMNRLACRVKFLFHGFRKTLGCLESVLSLSEEIKEKHRWETEEKNSSSEQRCLSSVSLELQCVYSRLSVC